MNHKYNKNGFPKIERSNALGIKDEKILKIPYNERYQESYLLFVRTNLSPLDFFAYLFDKTNYLFSSFQTIDSEANSNYLFHDFYTTCYFDEFAEESNLHFCIKNKSFDGKKRLFGTGENALFYVYPEKKQFHSGVASNQSVLFFDFDEIQNPENETNSSDFEWEEWLTFINKLNQFSINLLNKFDYIFPFNIFTYTALKPFFLNFPKMDILQYQMVKYSQVTNIDEFNSILIENITSYRSY